MSGEMFGRDIMLALTPGVSTPRILILLGPGSQTAAESPRHAHQMIVVQVASEPYSARHPVRRPPPDCPHREICVQVHTIDAS